MTNPERRKPLSPIYSEWQNPSDSRIDEIRDRLHQKRARQIVCAVFAALNPHKDASLPQNPFRKTDTADDAFDLVVAADQKLAPVYVPTNPPRFASIASDSGDWKPIEGGKFAKENLSSTANEAYCAEIKAAIQALMTGKKITPASNPSPETSQVAPASAAATPISPAETSNAPSAAGRSRSFTPDQSTPPAPPKATSQQLRQPLGTTEWWSAPASPPPAPPSPIPSPPSPGPAPPAPNSAPPSPTPAPSNDAGWDDEKWPDSE